MHTLSIWLLVLIKYVGQVTAVEAEHWCVLKCDHCENSRDTSEVGAQRKLFRLTS